MKEIKKRNYYYDNAKLILIILVVIGHSIENSAHQYRSFLSVFLFIYSFHMAAFVILSGYLSSSDYRIKSFISMFKRIVLPYVAASFLFLLLKMGPKDPWNLLIRPYFGLWYLLSLLTWRLALPFLSKVPPRILMPATVCVALIAGYFPAIGHAYTLSRTLCFLPFFMGGYYMRSNGFKLETFTLIKPARAFMALALIGLVAIAFSGNWRFASWIFYMQAYSLNWIPCNEWFAFAIRLVLLTVAAIGSIALLALVPTKKMRLSFLGAYTLEIFIYHMFMVKLLQSYGIL